MFCVAFFFLPISKPVTFVSLFAAFLLFAASDRFTASLASLKGQWWLVPALVLAAMPWIGSVVRPQARDVDYLNLSYYWVIAVGTFLAASQMRIVPWIQALLLGLLVAFCYTEIRFHDDPALATGLAVLANYILYSQFLAIGIALMSILYRREDRRGVKWIYAAGMILFTYGLVTNNGRSGLLALVLLLPMIFANLFPTLNRMKTVLVCAIAVIAVLMMPRVQTRINDGLEDIQRFEQDVTTTSLGYRFEMWKTAWDVFAEHPIIGAGPYGFKSAWHAETRPPEAQGFRAPHNAFLFFGSSYGAIGLGALLWLYFSLAATGWRGRRTLEGSVVLAFAVVCISGSLTNTMFLGSVSHAFLMLFIGMQGGLVRARAAPPEDKVRLAA